MDVDIFKIAHHQLARHGEAFCAAALGAPLRIKHKYLRGKIEEDALHLRAGARQHWTDTAHHRQIEVHEGATSLLRRWWCRCGKSVVSLMTEHGGASLHLRAVGGADEQDAAVGRGGVAALHLHQQLRLQPPARLVLAWRSLIIVVLIQPSGLHIMLPAATGFRRGL